MSNAMLNIYVRTFKRRMDAGETFEEILASYPRLTDEQAKEIKGALEEQADRIYNRTVRVELPSVVFGCLLSGSMDYLQRADKYSRKHKGHWCSDPAVVTATDKAGIVKPDGTTITVDEDGAASKVEDEALNKS